MTTPKLYRVPVEFDIYVMAENEEEAFKVARTNAAEEIVHEDDAGCGHPTHVTDIRMVPHAWRDSIPYAARAFYVKDATVAHILAGGGTAQ